MTPLAAGVWGCGVGGVCVWGQSNLAAKNPDLGAGHLSRGTLGLVFAQAWNYLGALSLLSLLRSDNRHSVPHPDIFRELQKGHRTAVCQRQTNSINK